MGETKMMKNLLNYLLSKSMKKAYFAIFALLLLCVTIASASAFTLMPGDVIINIPQISSADVELGEKDFSQPWNILGEDVLSDDVVNEIDIPEFTITPVQPEHDDIFEYFFNDVDKLNLKRTQLQKNYEDLNTELNKINTEKTEFDVCTIVDSIKFIQSRTKELAQDTTAMKYKVWGMKPEPGTFEPETKETIMKQLFALDVRAKELNHNVIKIMIAADNICEKQKQSLPVVEMPEESEEPEEPEEPIEEPIPVEEPELYVPGLDYLQSRYDLFNHASYLLDFKYSAYNTAFETKTFTCDEEMPLEEIASKSKELNLLVFELKNKVSNYEAQTITESHVQLQLLEKVKALELKVRKIALGSNELLVVFPSDLCDSVNVDDNSDVDPDDTTDPVETEDPIDPQDLTEEELALYCDNILSFSFSTEDEINPDVDYFADKDLNIFYSCMEIALNALTTNLEETKVKITDAYCAEDEATAIDMQAGIGFGGSFMYALFKGMTLEASAVVAEEDVELATKYGQLAADFDQFALNLGELVSMELVPELCLVVDPNVVDPNAGDQTDPTPESTETDSDKLNDFENQYDGFDEEYDNLKDDLETAEDDNDEDEVDDVREDLSDLYDEVDDLYDDLTQFKGLVQENLKDEVTDLRNDVKKLKKKIKCLADGEESNCYLDNNNDNSEDVSDYSYEYTPVNTNSNTNSDKKITTEKKEEQVDLITTSVQAPQETQPTTQTTEVEQIKFTESSTYFALLISGFVLLLGIAAFLGAVVVRIY